MQVLLNVIARGMSLLDALLAPRMHSQLLPDELYLEDYALTCPDCGLNHSISVHSLPLMQQSLQSRGHSVKVETNVGFSACQFAGARFSHVHYHPPSKPVIPLLSVYCYCFVRLMFTCVCLLFQSWTLTAGWSWGCRTLARGACRMQ